MIRVVLTADNHLGRCDAKMPPSVMAERQRRLRQAFEQVVQFACVQQVHLFLIAGDLFDTPNPRDIERTYLADALRRLLQHNVTVMAIGGHHDTPKNRAKQSGYVPQSLYHELGVMVFFDQSPRVQPWIGEIAGVKVTVGGITPGCHPLPGGSPLDGVVFEGNDAEVRILLMHHAIEGMAHSQAQETTLSRAAIKALRGVDYLFVGGIHRYDSFVLGDKRVVVPGATERMDFKGQDDRAGFVYLEIEPGRLDRQPQYKPIPSQPRARVLISAAELNGDDPTATVLARLKAASSKDTLLKLQIEGAISHDLFGKLDVGRIKESGRRDNFSFDLDINSLRVQRPATGILASGSSRSMRKELAACTDELLSATKDKRERAILLATRQALLAQYDKLVGKR